MKLLSPSNKLDTKVAPYTEARPNKTASVVTSEYRVYWYHTLQFRIVASFLALFLFIVLILAVVAQTLGEDLIQQQAQSKVSRCRRTSAGRAGTPHPDGIDTGESHGQFGA